MTAYAITQAANGAYWIRNRGELHGPFRERPTPGSEAARAKGCVCGERANDGGRGMLFYVRRSCPLHGEGECEG